MDEKDRKLEDAILDVEIHLPGIARLLITKDRTSGFHLDRKYPTDVKYVETENFKVAAANWVHKEYDGSGGIQELTWIQLYYSKKDSDIILEKKVREAYIRHRYESSKDQISLYQASVGLENLNSNKLEIYWIDTDGDKRHRQNIDLDR